MNPINWAELLQWFNVPGYKHLYVLGSFARHVTLYAQQVRALNLITALAQENIIHEGREVVVVGGGAAGLTAAAGAAMHGAKVWVLEELEELMELQRNNRQRWLHPYIYDWPDMESQEQEANLPLLRWSAGYSEQVAIQIETAWNDLKPKYSFTVRLGVTNIGITPGRKGVTVTWHEATQNDTLTNPVVILAVGFGLEPQNDYQDS
ncbi:MAG: FAD-dependent oxidoreductase, partial [Candidatus Angelobacter sp.]